MIEKNADTLKEINNHHASEAAAMRDILRTAVQWPGHIELAAESKVEAEKIGETLWTDLRGDDTEKKRAAIHKYNEYQEVTQRLEVSQQVLRAKIIVQTFELYRTAGKWVVVLN
ncbi:hypothetical protein CYMTET_37277 [Cymbomonas tetramitiformis]|uniref:Uncharacterized protein n=1 Tax=Cymbomonas tetramitiformis TaxID=36881 RepID=A0AAE0CG19_9CHLO|nr:hypothetical protein CYMTET_37277 [Cymbomonas tetramitiformis]